MPARHRFPGLGRNLVAVRAVVVVVTAEAAATTTAAAAAAAAAVATAPPHAATKLLPRWRALCGEEAR